MSIGQSMQQQAEEFRNRYTAVREQIGRVIVGHDDIVHGVLCCMLVGGHCLLEGVPGLGKTLLVRTLAQALNLQFSRIQFTPDLLPSDVTGVSVYNQKTGEFEFRPGPIISQIVLADEINRTSPKTQSALLECMEESQLTIDGITHKMPQPFLVLATQNPIEYEGTFPLPEAQLDRFLIRVRLGYPSFAEERTIVDRAKQPPLEDLDQVLSTEEVIALQKAVKQIHVDQSVQDYMIKLVQTTRENRDIYLGASPRGSISLFRTCQALAMIHGRDYVTPDDVKEMAPLTLAHRIIMKPEAQLRGATAERLITELLAQVPSPAGVKEYAAKHA